MTTDKNIFWHNATVTSELRSQQNCHKPALLWFTGLSGSGKSTLAHAVEEKLYLLKCHSFTLDGDNVRHGLCSDLGFSDADRKENIRRIGEVAKLMFEAGIIAMAAFISPFREDREKARNIIPNGAFIEIYCKASLPTCESRDTKGLYKLARAGKIKNYTGIDSIYEVPLNSELTIDTEKHTIEESVEIILNTLAERGIINKAIMQSI